MKNRQSALKIIRNDQPEPAESVLETSGFHVWIEDTLILDDIEVALHRNRINCIIGPSGAGKSTLIRSFNRINDETGGLRTKGSIRFNGTEIYDHGLDTTWLRSRIGMVFQKPAVFPVSIRENVLMGVRYHRRLDRLEALQVVEENLRAVSLWREVSHRLDEKGPSLSAGQQQRLCMARTLAVEPWVLLLDEPTSALDPVSSRSIEDLLLELKKTYTVVFVTHNIPQARRIADWLIFMCEGKIIEAGPKDVLFNRPRRKETEKYLREDICDC